MSQSLILIDALSSACWEEKKKRDSQEAFFLGWDMPCWLCHVGFLWLLEAIKS
jgi:hypothetical protein